MYPPIFDIAEADAGVTALLGVTPTRFWPFGRAPQKGQDTYGVPYAVHQLVYGTPENTLACTPASDNFGIQVDAYATSVSAARAVAAVLRDALEPHAYIVAWNGENDEPATGLYRVSFTVEFNTDR